MALTDKLSAIGDAIREKTGKTDLMTLDAMPAEIASITTGGGGGDLPEEAFVITGDCDYRFANDGWTWFIEQYGNQITTEGIYSSQSMFYDSESLEGIPFDLNFNPNTSTPHNMSSMFNNCWRLKTPPKINNVKPDDLDAMFRCCWRLREIPDNYCENWDWSYRLSATGSSDGASDEMFEKCYSLRRLPIEMLKYQNPNSTYYMSFYYKLANACYSLDEIIDLPIPYTATWTGNAFNYMLSNCSRLKNFTFETNEDGSPKVVKWKKQTIDLTSYVGWASGDSYILDYNSGITADKKVKDDATYQALKDNPDWYSTNLFYSRYNHDSAVRTINSLPDASAYLATAGGTNTIQFKKQAGQSTDGGAINTLTAEEIAVATAKGWTVSFAV